ncbi:hypothetical protein LTR85_002332 [Meristemomyces frigidus]|nr:hypothetical protein LTR85_002332 [Meristemomyces frigidus]
MSLGREIVCHGSPKPSSAAPEPEDLAAFTSQERWTLLTGSGGESDLEAGMNDSDAETAAVKTRATAAEQLAKADGSRSASRGDAAATPRQPGPSASASIDEEMLRKLHSKLSLAKSQVDDERIRYASSCRLTKSSLQSLFEVLQRTPSGDEFLRGLQHQFFSSADLLLKQSDITRRAEAEVSGLENQVYSRVTRPEARGTFHTKQPKQQLDDHSAFDDKAWTGEGYHSITERPSVGEQYVRKLGDLFILKERLVELDEERATKTLAVLHDSASLSGDAVSEPAYEVKRQALEVDLSAAQRDARHLKVLCRANGLDPKLLRRRRSSNSASQTNPMEQLLLPPVHIPEEILSVKRLLDNWAKGGPRAPTGLETQASSGTHTPALCDSVLDWRQSKPNMATRQ